MPSLLAVMQSRLGIQEVPGKKHNPVIVRWASDIGHPEVVDDETSWCSIMACSAAQEAGLPMPPHNVRMLARSWLTWGVKVDLGDIQPGDVAIWPRGDPKGWQGHVNVVETVASNGFVICIGGNQSAKGGDAVTRTRALDSRGALGFRRPVAATVKDLRDAGSTEIKKGDKVQNAGWLVTLIPSVIAAVKSLFGPVDVPQFADLKEGLSWWQEVIGGITAIGKLVGEYPWLAGTCLVGGILILVGHQLKSARVAKHEAGVPLSSEVVQLEGA